MRFDHAHPPREEAGSRIFHPHVFVDVKSVVKLESKLASVPGAQGHGQG